MPRFGTTTRAEVSQCEENHSPCALASTSWTATVPAVSVLFLWTPRVGGPYPEVMPLLCTAQSGMSSMITVRPELAQGGARSPYACVPVRPSLDLSVFHQEHRIRRRAPPEPRMSPQP